MLVVLSQRIDFESEYEDELFRKYHYPSRYRNQLHEGDRFVYYQGNRHDRKQRYYFGTGVISQISAADEKTTMHRWIDASDFPKRFRYIFHTAGI